jgi:hypothetical protein
MFLRDLFRYRTTNTKENREDFLSSCLAELMRRDCEICNAILNTLQLPTVHSHYWVQTQVGRIDTAGVARYCDILIGDSNNSPRIIECKIDAPTDYEQIQRYQKLWHTKHVALLACKKSLPKSAEWASIPQASWQQIWENLHTLHLEGVGDLFRTAVLDLMEYLDLQGCINLKVSQVLSARAAWLRQLSLQDDLKQAVLAILPKGEVDVKDISNEETKASVAYWQGEHQRESLMDVFWLRESVQNNKLYGLGLTARVQEGVGEPILAWSIWVCVTQDVNRGLDAISRKDSEWHRLGDGWERPLIDTGKPDVALVDQLTAVVNNARYWLSRDLKIISGQREIIWVNKEHSTRSLAEDMVATKRAHTALKQWSQRLIEDLEDLFKKDFPRLKPPWKFHRIKNNLRLQDKNINKLSLNWGYMLSKEKSILGLWLEWCSRREHESAHKELVSWAPPQGLDLTKVTNYTTCLSISLEQGDLKDNYECLLKACHSLLSHNNWIIFRVLGAIS